ncbi:MAG: ATP-binding cassette domain-containing protein [Verrucomicrobia bacterium]|nr:ATP-binding cassette domain-containing protein [Verrucomicrobiota bacterium]
MTLKLQNISLPLADFALELDVECHQRVTGIFGPSGAGKTSLLELIAGLRQPVSARITLGTTVLTDTKAGTALPVRERRIAYVPQDLALFPHLPVRANVLYSRKSQLSPEPMFQFEHVVRLLEIEPLLDREIGRLSGGEKQRVALARAILSSPHLLLLDEPLSGLDARLKSQILPFLRRIKDEFPIPILYVTHHVDEASALCDEVLVLERGRMTRRGTPAEVFGPSESTAR